MTTRSTRSTYRVCFINAQKRSRTTLSAALISVPRSVELNCAKSIPIFTEESDFVCAARISITFSFMVENADPPAGLRVEPLPRVRWRRRHGEQERQARKCRLRKRKMYKNRKTSDFSRRPILIHSTNGKNEDIHDRRSRSIFIDKIDRFYRWSTAVRLFIAIVSGFPRHRLLYRQHGFSVSPAVDLGEDGSELLARSMRSPAEGLTTTGFGQVVQNAGSPNIARVKLFLGTGMNVHTDAEAASGPRLRHQFPKTKCRRKTNGGNYSRGIVWCRFPPDKLHQRQ